MDLNAPTDCRPNEKEPRSTQDTINWLENGSSSYTGPGMRAGQILASVRFDVHPGLKHMQTRLQHVH